MGGGVGQRRSETEKLGLSYSDGATNGMKMYASKCIKLPLEPSTNPSPTPDLVSLHPAQRLPPGAPPPQRKAFSSLP